MPDPSGPAKRFRTKRLLGEGGYGRVWLVEDGLRPDQPLALKELVREGDRHAEAFRREYATLATLHHPSLVEVHGFDPSGESGLPRFTLEFIQGATLADSIRRDGPGTLPSLLAEALRALAFLHDLDLVHGDLKPEHVLVRDRPKLGTRLVLVDFGLARGAEPEDREPVAGTLPYIAPERFEGEPTSPKTDLYALGAVVFDAVHGRPPFAFEGDLGRLVADVAAGRRSRPPAPPGFPERLGLWIEDLLAPDPASRPSSAAEALASLNVACGSDFPLEVAATRAARLASGLPEERRDEIERVRRALDPASGPRVVWLAGEAGSGKSRIVRWIEAERIRDGWRTVAAAGGPVPASLESLREAAERGSVLLTIDDVEIAGAATAELLDRVARERNRPPLQVLAAVRPASVRHPRLQALLRDTGTVPTLRRVDLLRLDGAPVRTMAVRATGGPVASERVRRLLSASEGIPARVEALLVAGAWERGAREAGDAEPRPEIVARRSLLSPDAAAWTEALAVLRGEGDETVLAAVAGLDPGSARAAADEAAAAGLARRSGKEWRADSRAVVEAILGGIPAERSTALHLSAAARIARGGGDPWLLARLFAGAGDGARAVEAAVSAAEAAEAAGDPIEAAWRYGFAIARLRDESGRRAALWGRRGEAMVRAGLHDAAARAFGAAARLEDDARRKVARRAAQALALVRCGRFGRALSVAEEASARATDRGTRARADMAAGIVLARLGRERDAIPRLEQARRALRSAGEVAGEAEALHVLGTCRVRLGLPGGEESFRAAIGLLAADRGDGLPGGAELNARIGLASARMAAGETEDAEVGLESVLLEAREAGRLGAEQAALSRLAAIAVDDGRLDRAIDLAREAEDIALHLGDPNLVLVERCRRAEALVRCGRAGAAASILSETLEGDLDRVEPENADYARMALAEAWSASGRAGDAPVREILEATLGRCRERWKRRPWLMALAVEAERRARAGEEPLEPVLAELEAVGRGVPELLAGEIGIRSRLAAAMAALSRGDPGAAARAADEAAKGAKATRLPVQELRARALLVRAAERLAGEGAASKEREAGRRLLDSIAGRIKDEEVRAALLAHPDLAPLVERSRQEGGRAHERLLVLYDMIRTLNSESDPEALLASILDMALRALGAERGLIFLREGDRLAVKLVRNVEEETTRDAESYSRHIVEEAGAGRSLLAVDAGQDERFRDLSSVSLYGIRSLLCVPLRSRGRVVGTVYLDSRKDGPVFRQDDLRFLEAFADHAAIAIENLRTRVRLEDEVRTLRVAAESRTRFENLVGRCAPMQAVFDLVEKVASTDLPVLIRGESGTGKELVARAIHFRGDRKRRVFLCENCAAVPESLLEVELFGHERGAYTGAERSRPGLFEQADGGTLFLDEVGDMPASMQARLLRVLESGELRRVGAERPTRVDVRVLAATHRDLEAEVAAGRFREDLLYRMRVLTVDLPALRDRPGDVALLTAHFLERIASARAHAPWQVDDALLAAFERYRWPGNVRELENALQRLTLLAGDGPITPRVVAQDPGLRAALLGDRSGAEPLLSLKTSERERILHALEAAEGNRVRAARLLGISRAALYRKLRRHGI